MTLNVPSYIVLEVLEINTYDHSIPKNVHIEIIAMMLSHHYFIMQWSPKETLSSAISSAVYSSDGLMVYAGFRDGAIGIFEAESLGYNAGLHLLPTYLLQYLGMCSLQ